MIKNYKTGENGSFPKLKKAGSKLRIMTQPQFLYISKHVYVRGQYWNVGPSTEQVAVCSKGLFLSSDRGV